MKQLIRFTFGVLFACMLVSCAPPTSVPPTATVPRATEETNGATGTDEPARLPLSDPGPYCVGVREFSSQDASRDGREVGIRVWYPALWPEDAVGLRTIPKAESDRSGAPQVADRRDQRCGLERSS